MNIPKRSVYESGQALILIAALMIGMIAMVGLAVDGGGVYYLNRDLQNAVDAAVIAATYAKCTGGDITFAATQAIADNGFTPGGPDNVIITVNNPPATGPGAGNDEYVEVITQADKPSYFIQVVRGNAPLTVSARGVGHCMESTVNTAGKALVATCEGSGNGIDIQASGGCSADIVGGWHSNSDAKSGPGTCVEGDVSTTGSSDQVQGTSLPSGDDLGDVAESGASAVDYPFVWDILEFDEPTDIYPDRISARWDVPGGPKHYGTLASGFDLNANTLAEELMAEGFADPRVEPVLIYVNGDIRIKGPVRDPVTYYLTIAATGTIGFVGNLSGANWVNAGESPSGNWAASESDNGMDYLFMFSNYDEPTPPCSGAGGKSIDFNVNNGYFRGILYAPLGLVQISASSSNTSYGAIWAEAVKVSVHEFHLVFDTSWLPPDPPTIGIAE